MRISTLLFLFFCLKNAQSQQPYRFTHPQMGTLFHVDFYAKDSIGAAEISKKVFKKLDELNLILSDYRDDSEVNYLCRNAFENPTKVSDDLWKIINLSIEAEKLSKGNFDITVGTLSQLWRRMKRQKQLPNPVLIEEAKSKIGIENIILNPDNQTIKLKKQGIRIDFGGIGKGYAEDEMMKIFKENKIDSAMIEAGGNIVVSGGKWELSINNQKHFLSNCGISTSGDLYQFVEIDGKKYSHIVNPETGIGFTSSRQITVIASNSTTADWLSTAIYLMRPKKGRKLAKRMKAKLFER